MDQNFLLDKEETLKFIMQYHNTPVHYCKTELTEEQKLKFIELLKNIKVIIL